MTKRPGPWSRQQFRFWAWDEMSEKGKVFWRWLWARRFLLGLDIQPPEWMVQKIGEFGQIWRDELESADPRFLEARTVKPDGSLSEGIVAGFTFGRIRREEVSGEVLIDPAEARPLLERWEVLNDLEREAFVYRMAATHIAGSGSLPRDLAERTAKAIAAAAR